MVGRFSKPVTNLGVNAGIPDPKIFVHRTILVSWFLSSLGPSYRLFDVSVWFRVGIRVRVIRVLHLLWNYIEVAVLESLWRKFIKLVSLHMVFLDLLLPVFLLFLKALSVRVTFSNASAYLLLLVIHIIAGDFRVGGLLGVQNPISLAKGSESWFILWGFFDLIPCRLWDFSAGGLWVVIGSR